ncbi:hypothetical protein ABIC02_007606 [Bradyrhizobium sp. RT5a]
MANAQHLEPHAAGHRGGEANPRFVVTSLKRAGFPAKYVDEKLYCARGEMENRIKECQLDLYADRTSTATMRANQLRLWFASMGYVLVRAVRRIGLQHTPFSEATWGTIRLRLLKIGALLRMVQRPTGDPFLLPEIPDSSRASRRHGSVCPLQRRKTVGSIERLCQDSARYPS